MHGETIQLDREGEIEWGLSPHARGNQFVGFPIGVRHGTIPACTGKPHSPPPPHDTPRDYPRMHGETFGLSRLISTAMGLSPHARGNRKMSRNTRSTNGTIPACTGKPNVQRPALVSAGDYPRMHGETRAANDLAAPHYGLSPHARGNL